jgi:hypothetical protein
MKKVLINYAHAGFRQSQVANAESGIKIGKFDDAISYNIDTLDEDFKVKNAHILSQPRGAGYWIWKPHIILKTLNTLKDNDIVFYSDSGAIFIDSAQPLINLCNDSKLGIITFHLDPVPTNKETVQTKRDTFILMKCDDNDKIKNSYARHGGFSIWKKNAFTLEFLKEYQAYCEDERIVTDLPNTCGQPNYSDFRVHRHDQSVFSLLTKKYNIDSYPDPTQFGNPYIDTNSKYKQIIQHTRSRS